MSGGVLRTTLIVLGWAVAATAIVTVVAVVGVNLPQEAQSTVGIAIPLVFLGTLVVGPTWTIRWLSRRDQTVHGTRPSPQSPDPWAAVEARLRAEAAMSSDELEAEKARKLAYVSEQWDDGFGMIAAWVMALLIAIATGVVLVVVFAVVGRSQWAAVTGTVTGALAGAVLVPILFFGADFILSRLVRLRADNQRVRQAGRTTFEWISYGLLVLPAVLVVVYSVIES